MCPKFDGAIVALIILLAAAIAFLASTPWMDLAFVPVAVLGVAVACLLAKTLSKRYRR